MTTDILPLLPGDSEQALLVGRIWDPRLGGPRVAAVNGDGVHDLTDVTATVSELMERPDRAQVVRSVAARDPAWRTQEVLEASLRQDMTRPHLLAPVDLQVVKACGVTFVDSLIERVIEERIGGDPARAAEVRALIAETLGS